MPKKPARRSNLFLLELIIAILFFILAATACVRFFVQSHTLEKDSTALNQAVAAATSVAEIIRSQEEPYDILMEAFPSGEAKNDVFYIYYDNDWNLCEANGAHYTLSLETTYNDSFLKGYISVLAPEETIYELEIDKYLAGEEVLP